MFATSDDVDARFEGTLSGDQLDWVETRLGDVEAMFLTLVPRLGVSPSAMDLKNAKTVICDALLRVLRNPGGFTSQRAGSFAADFNASNIKNWLHFTTDELALFRTVKRRRVGMIRIGAPRWAVQ